MLMNSRVGLKHPRGEEVLSLDDVARLRVQPLQRHLEPPVRRPVVNVHPHHSPVWEAILELNHMIPHNWTLSCIFGV